MNQLPPLDYGSAERTQRSADRINGQLQLAILAAIPWSKPGQRFQSWWTPKIDSLKQSLAAAGQAHHIDKDNTALHAGKKAAAMRWTTAMWRAQWVHWEETFQ